MAVPTSLHFFTDILSFLDVRKIYKLSADPKAEKDFFPAIDHKSYPLEYAPAQL